MAEKYRKICFLCRFWSVQSHKNEENLSVFDENRYELLKFFYKFVFGKGFSNSTYDIF